MTNEIPSLADSLVVDWDKWGTPSVVTLNGKPFPWHLAAEAETELEVRYIDGSFGYMLLPFLANHVEVRGTRPTPQGADEEDG